MNKKLTLKKEKLRNLTPTQLNEVAGGVAPNSTTVDAPVSDVCNIVLDSALSESCNQLLQ